MDKVNTPATDDLITLSKAIYCPAGKVLPQGKNARLYIDKRTSQVGVAVLNNWKDKARFFLHYRLLGAGRYEVKNANRIVAERFHSNFVQARVEFRKEADFLRKEIQTWDLQDSSQVQANAVSIEKTLSRYEIAFTQAQVVAQDPRFKDQIEGGTFSTFATEMAMSSSLERQLIISTLTQKHLAEDDHTRRVLSAISLDVAKQVLHPEMAQGMSETNRELKSLESLLHDQINAYVEGTGTQEAVLETIGTVQSATNRLKRVIDTLSASGASIPLENTRRSLGKAEAILIREKQRLNLLANTALLDADLAAHEAQNFRDAAAEKKAEVKARQTASDVTALDNQLEAARQNIERKKVALRELELKRTQLREAPKRLEEICKWFKMESMLYYKNKAEFDKIADAMERVKPNSTTTSQEIAAKRKAFIEASALFLESVTKAKEFEEQATVLHGEIALLETHREKLAVLFTQVDLGKDAEKASYEAEAQAVLQDKNAAGHTALAARCKQVANVIV